MKSAIQNDFLKYVNSCSIVKNLNICIQEVVYEYYHSRLIDVSENTFFIFSYITSILGKDHLLSSITMSAIYIK